MTTNDDLPSNSDISFVARFTIASKLTVIFAVLVLLSLITVAVNHFSAAATSSQKLTPLKIFVRLLS